MTFEILKIEKVDTLKKPSFSGEFLLCCRSGNVVRASVTPDGHPQLRTETDVGAMFAALGRPQQLCWHKVTYHPAVVESRIAFIVDSSDTVDVETVFRAEREAQALARLHKSFQRAMGTTSRPKPKAQPTHRSSAAASSSSAQVLDEDVHETGASLSVPIEALNL